MAQFTLPNTLREWPYRRHLSQYSNTLLWQLFLNGMQTLITNRLPLSHRVGPRVSTRLAPRPSALSIAVTLVRSEYLVVARFDN